MKKWLAATGAAALVFLFVWQQVQATRLGFELDGARRAVQEARGRNAHLRLELERRTAPAELAFLARERLGMVPPSPESVVMLAHAGARPQAPAEVPAPEVLAGPAVAASAVLDAASEGEQPSRIGTHLLSWLLPSDPPRWR